MTGFLAFLHSVEAFFSGNSFALMLGSGLAFVFSKLVPSEKAGPLMNGIWFFFDTAAAVVLALGNALQALSKFLHDFLKSDGLNGVK